MLLSRSTSICSQSSSEITSKCIRASAVLSGMVLSHYIVMPLYQVKLLTLYLPVTKIAEFANSVDLDEVAHNEPPHLDLHCLPSSL